MKFSTINKYSSIETDGQIKSQKNESNPTFGINSENIQSFGNVDFGTIDFDKSSNKNNINTTNDINDLPLLVNIDYKGDQIRSGSPVEMSWKQNEEYL